MHLIRTGRHILNLRYLISSEEWGPALPSQFGPGVVRITMKSGVTFDLTGEEADAYRRAIGEIARPSNRTPGPGENPGTDVESGLRAGIRMQVDSGDPPRLTKPVDPVEGRLGG